MNKELERYTKKFSRVRLSNKSQPTMLKKTMNGPLIAKKMSIIMKMTTKR